MKALITGITSYDGYFLSQFLSSKGYEVHGVIRRNSFKSFGNLSLLPDGLKKQINLHEGDVKDTSFINRVVSEVKPDELYHLAAQSFVAYSFENPPSTYDINIGGTLNVVNAIRDYSPNTRLYFAATSELFGKPETVPQNENTPFRPQSLCVAYIMIKFGNLWSKPKLTKLLLMTNFIFLGEK